MRNIAIVVAVLASTLLAGGAGVAGTRASGSTPGIVFERDGDLYAISVDGRRTVQLTRTPVWREEDPAVSPDGRWIVYVRSWNGPSSLWLMRLDGRRARRLTSGGANHPTWSPDGRQVYYAGSVHGRFGETCGAIFRKRADGKEPGEQVTRPRGLHSHFQPSVSPDGERIAFTDANQCSGGTATFAVTVVDRYGRETDDLAYLPGNNHVDNEPFWEAPAWSPDGTQIALIGDFQTLQVANTDGTGVKRLTRKRFVNYAPPAWSPVGAWIAFEAGKSYDLFLIRSDGTGLHRLTRTKAYERDPAWLPRMPG